MRTLILLIALLLAAHAGAQPSQVTRVIQSFDFEERGRGNVEDLPMGWSKLEGSGLPHYVNGRLSSDRASSGRHSFRFDLDGGSLIYRYPSGKIPASPGSTFRLSTRVSAAPLANARARLTGYFTDIDGRPIKSSVQHSRSYAGDAEGTWATLEMDLTAGDDAAWVVIELGLVQPAVWRQTTLGQSALFEQDIQASAYFDDVSIAQVPQVRLTAGRLGNVFFRSDAPHIKVSIQDRFTQDLVAHLTLHDAEGKSIYQRNGALDLLDGPGGAKLTVVELPELPAGWYRASLRLSSRGTLVSEQVIDFVRLADDGVRVDPDPRFGVIATEWPMNQWNALPKLLPMLGTARVKLGVWTEAGEVDQMTKPKFSQLLEQLRDLRITPTACILAPPPAVAVMVGGSTWDHLLKAPPAAWQPSLSFMVSRYAGFIDRWQFGSDDQAGNFAADANLRTAYAAVRGQFEQLMEKPDLAMPWPAWSAQDERPPAAVALSVPPDVLPPQIPLYLSDLPTDKLKTSISLQWLQPATYGRLTQLRDMVQRVTYALSAGATRIDLPMPFTPPAAAQSAASPPVASPLETMLVTRTLMQTLGNATFKGRAPMSEDVEAFLFDRQGEGVLVMWTKANTLPTKSVSVVLGAQPRRVDVWGNVSPVLQPRDASGLIEVEVGPMPIFLVGIDSSLAQLRASFAIDNPMIESSFKPHTRRLRFTNTYSVPISGSIRLTGPANWSVVPLTPSFSLNPGETYDGPIKIEFPYNAYAGEKTIDCQVQLQADAGRSFRVPVTLRLGLGDVGLTTMAMRDGDALIVQQVITNYSNRPIDYGTFAIIPDQPRQERLLTQLPPGKTVIKKYRFPNVPKTTATIKVRTGLKETNGTRVLNDETSVQ